MAISVIKDVSDYNFSSELQKLQFSTNKSSAKFTLKCGDETILSETYVPDDKGVITILQLDELVSPYLWSNLIEPFSYVLDDGDTPIAKTFSVQLCTAECWLPAKTFNDSYFLSTLIGDKETSIGRKEVVHLIITAATDVVAVVKYFDASYQMTTSTFMLSSLADLNKVLTVDVSSELFEVKDKKLVEYTIKADARSQTFKVVEAMDAAPCLLFSNSFGCQETLYCTGTHTLAPEYTRSSAYRSGMFRNYDIEEKRIFKANTGPLTIDMAQWAHDLFRSKEIYLLNGLAVGKEITITDSKDEQTNDFDHVPSFTFSYQYAQRNHNILQLPRAGRVFDNTFDQTFE